MKKDCPFCGAEVKIVTYGGCNDPYEDMGTCRICESEYYNGDWDISYKANTNQIKKYLSKEGRIHLLRLELGAGQIAATITDYEPRENELYIYTSNLKDEIVLDYDYLEFSPEKKELIYHDYNKNLTITIY